MECGSSTSDLRYFHNNKSFQNRIKYFLTVVSSIRASIASITRFLDVNLSLK